MLGYAAVTAAVLGSAMTSSCTDDEGCELNGICDVPTGSCKCETAWGGETCSTLQLLPAKHGAGYRNFTRTTTKLQTSSWGGGAIFDEETALWNMYAAEIMEGCGMNDWWPNSRVIRLTSATPDGAYTRHSVVIPAFSHNPQVVRTPDGGVAIYAIGNGTLPADELCRNCYNGSSGVGGSCNATQQPLLNQSVNVWTAKTVAGPFRLAGTLGLEPFFDNVAPYIFPNGSALIMWRGTLSETIGCEAVGTAASWVDGPFDPHADVPTFPPNTDFPVPAEPCLSDPVYKKPCSQSNIEDPHLWRSTSTGHFHALLHNGCDHDCPWVGRHAFSRDGRRWTLSHNIAYTTRIEFADGSVEVHKRRERPHVILSHATGEPVALVTALFEREIPTNNATGRHGNDASYTFIQPIKQAKEGPGTRTRTKDDGY